MTDDTPHIPEAYRHDLEIVRNTAMQTISDFGSFGIEISFSGNALTAYGELKSQLVAVLLRVEKNQPALLSSLLYRIDVDESKIAEVLHRNAPGRRHEMMADLILERELVKAVYRKLHGRTGH